MKYFIPILMILSSCITQQKCFEKFPPDVKTIVHDTIIYRDTIIYIQIKGDTVYKEVKLTDTVRMAAPYNAIYAETEFATARAWVSLDRLKMRLVQKESWIKYKLDSVRQASQHTEIVTKIVEKPLPPRPFFRIGFFILAGIVILFLSIFAIKI